jgi:oligoribonuclease
MIIWTDLETTGLDLRKDKIIEVAVVVTNDDLDIQGEMYTAVVKQPVDLSQIRPEVVDMHSKNGLWFDVSKAILPLAEVDVAIVSRLKKMNLVEKESPLGGSSVHFDRMWIMHHMPRFAEFVHYRNIDVSTLKTLAHKWKPAALRGLPDNPMPHRASHDIIHSIETLRVLRKKLYD